MKDDFNVIMIPFFGFFAILPLAIWKVVDIIIWLVKNVNITFGG